MADGFKLVGEGLRGHAGQLDGITDRLRQTVDAANQVSMPTDAYGIICQPFRMLLDPVEKYGIDALTKAVEAMETVAQGVRQTAEQYESTDESNASTFRGGQA
jgi:hypothetical protein